MDPRADKLWHRGIVHFQQGNLEAAQASFEAFLARQPGSGPALFRLSLVAARQGRHGAALARAEQALAIDPTQVEVIAHLARCQLGAGRPERARALAMQALAQPRDKPVVLDALATVMTRLEEPALALDLFDQALVLDPGQPWLHFNRALARKRFGQVEGAERDLERCLARLPNHAKAHWTLANLRCQDLAGNHVRRLRAALAVAAPGPAQTIGLALFKELDDLGDGAGAADVLRQVLASRAQTPAPQAGEHGMLVDALLAQVGPRQVGPATIDGRAASAPVFVVGMPRAGVALLGSLLSRHPRLHWLGRQQAFARQLGVALGQSGDLAATDVARACALDLDDFGARYLAEVVPPGAKSLAVCQSVPLDYLQLGFIARALPQARFLHVVRDPVDTCASLLFQPAGDAGLSAGDPPTVAANYLHYQRLMQHWHALLPGRIMDVSYESLVEKPAMMLRVICSFLGIRYASALRMGLQLHRRGIGRGHRYLAQLPGLESGLAGLERPARRA